MGGPWLLWWSIRYLVISPLGWPYVPIYDLWLLSNVLQTASYRDLIHARILWKDSTTFALLPAARALR